MKLFPYFKCHITRTIKIRICCLKIKLLLKISILHNERLKKKPTNKQTKKKKTKPNTKTKTFFLNHVII